MNCTSCGRPLPEGVAFCPACGTAAPYNTPKQGPISPYDPTEASPYGNGSPQNYPPLPPTVASTPDSYPPQSQNPYTNYGAGTPQQAPYDPYNMSSAYSGAPPPPANPMGSEPYYGAPPMGSYPPGMQPGMYPVPQKKRSRVGLIVGISVLAFLLLCGGLIVAATQLGKKTATITTSINQAATATADSTSNGNVNTTTGNAPTTDAVVPAAKKILSVAQTSNGVNSDYSPSHVTDTFATGKEVDLTFQVDSAGKNGYIEVKWYEDGQQVYSDILAHHAENNQGYFGLKYTAAGNGVAALYWCTKANCSDEQLAQVVNFTISDTALAPSTNTAIAVTDRKRNND
jgi:hypothetical protein